jgi:hypothetical protein
MIEETAYLTQEISASWKSRLPNRDLTRSNPTFNEEIILLLEEWPICTNDFMNYYIDRKTIDIEGILLLF